MNAPNPAPPADPAPPPVAGAGTGPEPPPPREVSRTTGREVAVLVAAVLLRPDLWWTALGELRRMAPHLWWRTAPHLPLPDRRLWEFRMVTAYGRADAGRPGPT